MHEKMDNAALMKEAIMVSHDRSSNRIEKDVSRY
jgi:hypothetical protein